MEQIDPRRHRHHDDSANRSDHGSKHDKARTREPARWRAGGAESQFSLPSVSGPLHLAFEHRGSRLSLLPAWALHMGRNPTIVDAPGVANAKA